jgi:hypothetical protein
MGVKLGLSEMWLLKKILGPKRENVMRRMEKMTQWGVS